VEIGLEAEFAQMCYFLTRSELFTHYMHGKSMAKTPARHGRRIGTDFRRMIGGRLEDADPTEAGYGGDDLLADKLEALEAVAKFVAS
jgi:hypothetical protein